jgi:3',5'-cyclic AMP phosphodiesterase CpdA
MPALLHVSDMHFSADPGRFRFESPEKLATIIAEAVVGENVDYIVLSGDFTWEAEPTEFNLASRFVEHLGEFLSVPKRRLVLTAGNHDVVWPSGDRKLRYDDRN